MNKKEIIKLKEKIEKLKKEKQKKEELFDNSKGLEIRRSCLDDIQNIDFKIHMLNVKLRKLTGTYEEEEDIIKMPLDSILTNPIDFGFCCSYEDEY